MACQLTTLRAAGTHPGLLIGRCRPVTITAAIPLNLPAHRRRRVEPAYLSKIERGEAAPPSEATTVKLAKELGEDPDVLLAMAGKVSSDLQAIIRKRPELFSELIRQLKMAPNHAILKVVREVRDGDW